MLLIVAIVNITKNTSVKKLKNLETKKLEDLFS